MPLTQHLIPRDGAIISRAFTQLRQHFQLPGLRKASRSRRGAARWLPQSACTPSPRTCGQHNLPGPPASCPQTEVCPRGRGSVREYSLRPKLVATC